MKRLGRIYKAMQDAADGNVFLAEFVFLFFIGALLFPVFVWGTFVVLADDRAVDIADVPVFIGLLVTLFSLYVVVAAGYSTKENK